MRVRLGKAGRQVARRPVPVARRAERCSPSSAPPPTPARDFGCRLRPRSCHRPRLRIARAWRRAAPARWSHRDPTPAPAPAPVATPVPTPRRRLRFRRPSRLRSRRRFRRRGRRQRRPPVPPAPAPRRRPAGGRRPRRAGAAAPAGGAAHLLRVPSRRAGAVGRGGGGGGRGGLPGRSARRASRRRRSPRSRRLRAALPAGCALLRVELPRGTRYVGFRYEATGERRRADCLPNRPCPAGECRFPGDPVVRREGDRTTVLAWFEVDRRPPRARRSLTVYYAPGRR